MQSTIQDWSQRAREAEEGDGEDAVESLAAQARESVTVQEAVREGQQWLPDRTFDSRLGKAR